MASGSFFDLCFKQLVNALVVGVVGRVIPLDSRVDVFGFGEQLQLRHRAAPGSADDAVKSRNLKVTHHRRSSKHRRNPCLEMIGCLGWTVIDPNE